MNSAFEVAFRGLIANEGGYVNDPADPGGETKYGISKRSYPDWDIKSLTLEQAKQIYYADFWKRLRCDEIVNDRIAIELFDTAVNMGRGAAVRLAQKACNLFGSALAEDGVIGPATLEEINRWARKDAQALFRAMNGFQFMRYVDIVEGREESRRFIRGWMRRVQDYRQ